MRLSKLSYFCLSAFLLSVSCSKETTKENEESVVPETENPETGKSSRTQAKKLYTDYYTASQDTGSEVSWTGNLPSCDPGDVPQATRDKILMRLAYFRKAVGLHNEIAENLAKSDKAQKAALIMHANGSLNHKPPSDWKCFSEDGKNGAGNSLLTSTRNAGAIDSYMRDQGSENYPVGHRRWLLWPQLQEIGIGNTSSYNAVWVLGDAGTPPADAPEFIAWPPPGYLPKQLAYPRWSFSIAKADFTATTVSMNVKNAEDITVETEEMAGIYGDKTIVWRPAINPSGLTEDTTYVVNLKNVDIGGEAQEFEYEVTLFDVTQ